MKTNKIYLLLLAALLVPAATFAQLNYPGGRIALSFDGNQHDNDDMIAAPMSLAFINAAGLKPQMVHLEHSNHVGDNDARDEQRMITNVNYAANAFGFDASKIYNYQKQPKAATANLAAEINKSTASNPLWIIAAGPMETVWRGINASDPAKRKFVTVISHSNWNNRHNDTPQLAHTWDDIATQGVNRKKILDQNRSNGDNDFSTPVAKWNWLKNNSRVQEGDWLFRNNPFSTKFDPSDVGMVYYLITGGPVSGGCEKCGPREARVLLEGRATGGGDNGGGGDDSGGGETCGIEEQGGLVVIEAENTKSARGKWINQKNVTGYTGSGHIEFTGNGSNGGSATSPLEYTFKINKAGTYRLWIRAHKQLDGQPGDKNNDGYIRMKGDFTAGGGASLENLKKNNKFFGGAPRGWAWAKKLDIRHRKQNALYNFKAGETYTLVLSGRSIKWNVDRIILFHSSLTAAQATDVSVKETKGSCEDSPTPEPDPVASTVDATRVLSGPTIDGTLDEAPWEISTTASKVASGASDNTLNFGVLWDSTYLYVGAQVSDADLINDSGQPFQDDALEIYLDANNSKGTTYDADDNQLVIGYGDSTMFSSKPIEGVLYESMATEEGYSVEVAIPWASLGESKASGDSIGFDIGLVDDDNGDTREGQLVWAGSGANFRDPSGFGQLVLASAPADTTGADTLSAARSVAQPEKAVGQASPDWFRTYPNPASERLTVEGSQDYRVGVYDLSGRTVLERGHLQGRTSLDVSHLRPGVYVMKISDGIHPQLQQRVVVE